MIGLFFFKKQKSRLNYFYDLVGLINSIYSDVRFRQDKLSTVMKNYLETCTSQLSLHISEYLSSPKGELQLSRQCLKVTELKRVERFFASLGRTDTNTQILELDGYKAEFDEDLKKAKAHNDKYGSLYLKLGLAVGLGLGIVFV